MELRPHGLSGNVLPLALSAGLVAVGLTTCSRLSQESTPPPVAEATAEPITFPSLEPSPEPTPSPVPSISPRPIDPMVALQRNLNNKLVRFGMPALKEDGKAGAQTKRAVCAVRLLTGREASMALPSAPEMKVLSGKLNLSFAVSGLIVSRTCQIMSVNLDKKLSMVIPVSTGRRGYRTPRVDGQVSHGRFGWHNSTLYPDETGEGNMYKPLYFSGSIAVHGSREMFPSVTTPRSHGCVRVLISDADKLWLLAGGPKTAEQDQDFTNLKPLPVHVL
jgi:hypothetical protein